jgi:hypothetical protein
MMKCSVRISSNDCNYNCDGMLVLLDQLWLILSAIGAGVYADTDAC